MGIENPDTDKPAKKYHGPKVVDFRAGEIRKTIRKAFNSGLQDCRNCVILFEGKSGGLYVNWSSVDVSHTCRLLEIAHVSLSGTAEDRA